MCGFRGGFKLKGWLLLVLGVGLALGIGAGVLSGASPVRAAESQTYTVLAGAGTAPNAAVLAFAPQSLQVHRGDTVMWIIDSFHNIHFSEGLTDLVVAPEVEGVPLPQVNPAVAFPTVENGGVYQGGDANSGLPLDPANPMVTFSLVMDVAPGTYAYYCDIHPGMAGTVTVVDAETPIPSPDEALAQGAVEIAMSAGAATEAAMTVAMQPLAAGPDGAPSVAAGLQAGQTAVLQFYPSVAVIQAGQSVTWTVPADSMEPHTVTWPPAPPGSEFNVIPQDAGPPILALSELAMPAPGNVSSEVGAEGTFNSGFLMPGQSFTLRFTEPGVYNYVCFIHPGMQGTVVVQPAS